MPSGFLVRETRFGLAVFFFVDFDFLVRVVAMGSISKKVLRLDSTRNHYNEPETASEPADEFAFFSSGLGGTSLSAAKGVAIAKNVF